MSIINSTAMIFAALLNPLNGHYQGTVFAHRETVLSTVLWLGLPVALFVASVVILLIDQDLFTWWARSEFGPGENLTAGLFVVSGVLAFRLAGRKLSIPVRWLRGAFFGIGVLAFLVAGEEISWGQHFFGWETPDWIAEVNKQQETNLHNIAEDTLDQKPRAIFTFTILAVGFLLPLFRNRITVLDRFPFVDWLMPGRLLIPTTLLVFLPRVIERFQLWFDISLTGEFIVTTRDYQELQELFISIFIFIYLLNLLRRVGRFEAGETPSTP